MSSAICLVWAQARDTPPHDRRGPPFHPQQPLAFHRLARAPPRAKSPAVARLRRARDGGREEHSPLACRGLVFPSYSCGGCEPGFRKVAASPPGCAPRPGPSPDVLRACVRCLGCGCASGGLGAAEEVPWGRGGPPWAHWTKPPEEGSGRHGRQHETDGGEVFGAGWSRSPSRRLERRRAVQGSSVPRRPPLPPPPFSLLSLS